MIRRVALAALGIASVGYAQWAVPDAPLRAVFRAGKENPTVPEAGWLLELPELGHTQPLLSDVLLTDARGQPLPVARIYRNEDGFALLLAQKLPPGEEVQVYFGGKGHLIATDWTPKVSLLAETRRLPPGTRLDTVENLRTAWESSKDHDGAGFIGTISLGENPYGESGRFLSHFTGWLKTPGKAALYTVSSDASFVLADGKAVVAWPGVHGPRTNEKTVSRGEIGAGTGGLVKIDYWHAKAGDDPPVMVLGWVNDGKLLQIPASAWVHPGKTEFVRAEHAQGWPVPVPRAAVKSYIGWSGEWFYETQCSLDGGVPPGWNARWEFSDGAVMDGTECARVLVGNAPVRAVARCIREKDEVRGARRIDFHGTPPEASVEKPGDLRRYLALLAREDPAQLAPATLAAHLRFLVEFGSDDVLGRYGAAYVAKNPNPGDALWLPAQVARIRSLSQRDPKAALVELRRFDAATMKKFPADLGLLELDILVFGLKDPAAVPFANRLAFDNADSDTARLAKVRIGDLDRLLGKTADALAWYKSVQKTIADESAGRKFAAEDRAYSITIEDLLAQGDRRAAMAKLTEWEVGHPAGKYDSDFLLLRGRALMEFARWNEALQEIESFRTMQPDSPYQILADFHRARAIFELGRKDEARKIWEDISTKYPKHELAAECRRLSQP